MEYHQPNRDEHHGDICLDHLEAEERLHFIHNILKAAKKIVQDNKP